MTDTQVDRDTPDDITPPIAIVRAMNKAEESKTDRDTVCGMTITDIHGAADRLAAP